MVDLEGEGMEHSIFLFLPVPYLVNWLGPRQRNQRVSILVELAPVDIRQVAAQEAPVCFEIRRLGRRDAPAMDWRYFEGAFWRPFVGPDRSIVTTTGDLQALLETSDPRWWVDHPFPVSPPNQDDLPERIQFRQPLGEGCRVVQDERETAVADARRRAAVDFIIIDGRVYRRSPPPVYGVGDPHCLTVQPGTVIPVPVCLRIPGYRYERSIAHFGLDRLPEALELARRLSEDNPSGQRTWSPAGILRHEQDVDLTWHRSVELPDERVGSFGHTLTNLEYALRPVWPDRMPPAMQEAHRTLIAIDERLQGGWGMLNDLVAEGLRAIDVIIDATPDGGDPWRWTRSVKMIARAQKWRFEIEGNEIERANPEPDEDDAGAFSTLHPGAI